MKKLPGGANGSVNQKTGVAMPAKEEKTLLGKSANKNVQPCSKLGQGKYPFGDAGGACEGGSLLQAARHQTSFHGRANSVFHLFQKSD